jgi:hypothetical protein
MKYKIKFYSLGQDMFSDYYCHSTEYVIANTQEELDEFVMSRKDQWGHKYERNELYDPAVNPYGKYRELTMNRWVYLLSQYKSGQGVVFVEEYREPEAPAFKEL